MEIRAIDYYVSDHLENHLQREPTGAELDNMIDLVKKQIEDNDYVSETLHEMIGNIVTDICEELHE